LDDEAEAEEEALMPGALCRSCIINHTMG
jgi:hypothetical protein